MKLSPTSKKNWHLSFIPTRWEDSKMFLPNKILKMSLTRKKKSDAWKFLFSSNKAEKPLSGSIAYRIYWEWLYIWLSKIVECTLYGESACIINTAKQCPHFVFQCWISQTNSCTNYFTSDQQLFCDCDVFISQTDLLCVVWYGEHWHLHKRACKAWFLSFHLFTQYISVWVVEIW